MSYDVMLGDRKIGYIGEINNKIAKAFGIKQKSYAAVLDSEILLAMRREEPEFRSLPRFPAAPRDLAVVVDENVKVGEMLAVIRKNGDQILEKVELFDLFRGKQIGAGKKSLAFSMIYRLPDRSLENEEVQKTHSKIAEALKKQFGAEVREG